MQVRGASKGYVNSTSPIFHEYLTRLSLAKLGYNESIENIDCFMASCFSIIEQELNKLERDAIDSAKKKARSR